jgi:hypothetical protein
MANCWVCWLESFIKAISVHRTTLWPVHTIELKITGTLRSVNCACKFWSQNLTPTKPNEASFDSQTRTSTRVSTARFTRETRQDVNRKGNGPFILKRAFYSLCTTLYNLASNFRLNVAFQLFLVQWFTLKVFFILCFQDRLFSGSGFR